MTKLEFQAQIDNYRNLIRSVEETIPNEIHMSMALIDCRSIKSDIVSRCKKNIEQILEKVMGNTQFLKQRINDDVTQIFSALTKTISSPQELEEAQNKIDSIEKDEKRNIDERFALVFDWIQMMYNNEHAIDEVFLRSTWVTAEKVQQIYSKV